MSAGTNERYLIKDGSALYAISGGELAEIESAVCADAFIEYGISAKPPNSVFLALDSPSLLCWIADADLEPPECTADITAMPPTPQICYSQNYDMTDPSIYGIENCEIVADSTTNFAFSFDGGDTWKTYINSSWVALTEDGSGMSAATVNAIPTEAWNTAVSTQWMVRFALFEGGWVESIAMHYINEEDVEE